MKNNLEVKIKAIWWMLVNIAQTQTMAEICVQPYSIIGTKMGNKKGIYIH